MKNKYLVVIPFNLPWEWSTDYTNQTAFELAKKGNFVICYMWSESYSLFEYFRMKKWPKLIKKYSKNVYLYYPILFLPFRRFFFILKLNEKINIALLKLWVCALTLTHEFDRKMLWVFDPLLAPLLKYFQNNWFLIYDCVDFFAIGDRKRRNVVMSNEKYLCKTANLVTANSLVLQNHLKKYRNNVKLVPQGFRFNDFSIKRDKCVDLNLKSPIIGFIGGLNNRLDTTLLLGLIKNNPKWNFVFWGPIQKDLSTGSNRLNKIKEILRFPNVYTGASRNKKEIPGIISQFDIGIIPYDISQDFNKYCYPMKIFEYFYLGKPVVSTNIFELNRFPELVKIGNNFSQWKFIVDDLLSRKWPKSKIFKQKKLSELNSWEKKIDSILTCITDD